MNQTDQKKLFTLLRNWNVGLAFRLVASPRPPEFDHVFIPLTITPHHNERMYVTLNGCLWSHNQVLEFLLEYWRQWENVELHEVTLIVHDTEE